MNLEEARKLARHARMSRPGYKWSNEPGVMLVEGDDFGRLLEDRDFLAGVVLELADEVERLQSIELAARPLCESAGPLVEMPGYEFVESDKMSMLLSALYGPDEELMDIG